MTDRQTKILEIVNQKKKVEVATLSKMLDKRTWICDNEEYVRHQQSYGFLL